MSHENENYQEFIQIKPSSGRLIPEDIVNHIRGFRKFGDDWTRRYNPAEDPPRFEFLVAGRTKDNPIRFLFRTLEEKFLDSLEAELRVSYPDSFEIQRVTVDRAALHHPNPTPRYPDGANDEDGVGAYDHREEAQKTDQSANLPDTPATANRHNQQTQPSHQNSLPPEDRTQNVQQAQQNHHQDSAGRPGQSQQRSAQSPRSQAQYEPGYSAPADDQQTLDENGTENSSDPNPEPQSGGGDINAVPMDSTFKEFSLDTFQDCHAEAVHWYGRGERRNDWQTLIERFTQITKRQRQKEGTERRERASPLGTIVDLLADSEYPICLQVVFARRRYWGRKERRRQSRLENNRDTLSGVAGAALDTLIGDTIHRDTGANRPVPNEGQDTNSRVEESGQDLGTRQQHISAKGSSDCYRVNIRAVGFCPASATATQRGRLESTMESISNVFNHLSGQFYNITGKRVGDGSFREKLPKSRKTTIREELQNFIDAKIQITNVARTRAQLTLNSDELANFIVVPSEKQLTDEAVRSIDSKEQTREPIGLPKMSILENYLDNGIPLGYPLEDNHERRDVPACMPPALYDTHYLRSGATGQGKSVAINNELLAWSKTTSGPNILIEPKGGDMAQNYLLTHKILHGDIDDVIYFHAPEDIPAMPFFDIRPLLAAGYDRRSAIQDKLIQFDEIMRVVMGEEEYGKAQHSINFLKNVICAAFDGTYGEDAFTIAELRSIVWEMKMENKIPQVSNELEHVRENFEFILDEPDQFSQIAQGAINRLSILTEDQHLRKMLNHIPEWDEETQTYAEHGFDLHHLIEEDKTIIFDLGDLRDSSQKAITLITLGYLWDALKHRTRRQEIRKEYTNPSSTPNDFTVTTILEEAKLFADTKMVEKFLAQGREFDLSLGLIMQFPDQANDNNIETDVYKEIIENVGVKVLGEMQIPEKIADMLASETINSDEYQNRLGQLPRGEWIVQMKGTEYFAEKPNPFHVQSLEPPVGHDASSKPYSPEQKEKFGKETYPERMDGIRREYCVPDGIKDRDIDELSRDVSEDGNEINEHAEERKVTTSGTDHRNRLQSKSGKQATTSKDTHTNGPEEMVENDGWVVESESKTPASPSPDDHQPPDPEQIEYPSNTEETRGGAERYAEAAPTSADSGSTPNASATTPEDQSAADSDAETAHQDAPFTGTVDTGFATTSSSDGRQTIRDLITELPPLEEASAEQEDALRELIATASATDTLDDELTLTELSFLGFVYLAEARELPGYSLLESMSQLPMASEADIDLLVDNGYLESDQTLYNKRYYTTTKQTRSLLDVAPPHGDGIGDLGEATPHRAAVTHIATVFEQDDNITDVNIYDGEVVEDGVLDVTAYNDTGSLARVAEVERELSDTKSIIKDHKQMTNTAASVFWVVPSLDVATGIIERIQGRTNDLDWVSTDDVRSWSELQTELQSGPDRVVPPRVVGFRSVTKFIDE